MADAVSAVGDAAKDLTVNPLKTAVSKPMLFIGVGLVFLLIVLTIETFRPGLITNPIRRLLGMVGVKAKT